MRFWCRFDFAAPLFSDSILGGLHALIKRTLPGWSKEMQVARSPDSNRPVRIAPDDNLLAKLSEVADPERPAQQWVITFGKRGLLFIGNSSTSRSPGENTLAIEVNELRKVDSLAPADWLREFVLHAAGLLSVRYGQTYMEEEFEAKNTISSGHTYQVMGVDLSRCLPGLYWLNVFGPVYVRLMGEDRLAACPAFFVKKCSGSVVIQLDKSPEMWDTPAYQETERRVISHLGPQFFFDKLDPDRTTTAPRFQ